MARIHEIAQTTVLMNGKQAQDELKRLTALTEQYEKKRRDAFERNDHAAVKKFEKAIRDTKRETRNLQQEMVSVEHVLRNLNGSSINDIRRAANKAARELRAMAQTDPGYKKKQQEVALLNQRYRELNNELRGVGATQQSVFARGSAMLNKYFAGITAGLAAVTGLTMTLRRSTEEAARMDDAYSDVMKATGMTRERVVELNEAFKQMNTRTSRHELNELAYDAGKLGLSLDEEVLHFVEAGNQIRVALGKDLGDDAIKNIGKMVGVFDKSTEHLQNIGFKEQMLAVGSAVNELGMASTASEAYLVSFAGRLGGIASQAGLAIDQVLGFASALDQDMQKVEMSATAFSKFISKIIDDPAKFARIAGKEVSEFSEMLSTDFNGAILSVLHSLNKEGGLQQLAPIFKDMGMDAERAKAVMASLASSVEKVEQAQRIANQGMIEGISVTNEYNIKNNNMAAQREKARKEFLDISIAIGEKLNPAMLAATRTSTLMLKGVSAIIEGIPKLTKYIAYSVAIWAAYNAKLIENTIVRAGNILAMKEGIGLRIKEQFLIRNSIVAEQLHTLWKGHGTRATKLATSAQIIFNNAVKANPLGLLITAITAAVAAIRLYDKHSRATRAAEKTKAQAMEEVSRVGKELDEVYAEQAKSIAKLNELSKEQKQELYDQTLLALNRAEAELALLRAEQERVGEAAKHTTLWQRFINTIAAAAPGGFAHSIEFRNHLDTVKNSIEAMGELDEPIDHVLERIAALRDQSADLWNMLNPKKEPGDPNKTPESQEALDDEIYKAQVKIAEDYYNRQLLLMDQALLTRLITKKEYDSELEDMEIEHQYRLLKLAQDASQETVDIERKIAAIRLKQKDATDKELAEAAERAYEEERMRINKRYIDGLLTKEQQQEQLKDLELPHLLTMMELRRQLGMDTIDLERKLAEMRIAELESEAAKREEVLRKTEEIYKGFIDAGAKTIEDFIGGNEDALAEGAKAMIGILLNALKAEVQMSIVGATAQSLASPESIATGGIAGLAKAAIITGLIEAAFAALKGSISGLLSGIGSKKKGYYYGGFTTGDERDVAGVVHGQEFVATARSTRNPRIRPILEAIDRAQIMGVEHRLGVGDLPVASATAGGILSARGGGGASTFNLPAAISAAKTIDVRALRELDSTVVSSPRRTLNDRGVRSLSTSGGSDNTTIIQTISDMGTSLNNLNKLLAKLDNDGLQAKLSYQDLKRMEYNVKRAKELTR